jgi:hypothetical protein
MLFRTIGSFPSLATFFEAGNCWSGVANFWMDSCAVALKEASSIAARTGMRASPWCVACKCVCKCVCVCVGVFEKENERELTV